MKNTTWLVALALITLPACQENPTSEENSNASFHAVAAPEWNALFKRQSGWFGGDGIFAIPRPGGKQMILFSDTMIGEIENDSLQKGYYMINNSAAFLSGKTTLQDSIQFRLNRQDGRGKAIFLPNTSDSQANEYYWLGDGFVDQANQHTYVFAYRVLDHPEWKDAIFTFEITGSAMIRIDAESEYPFADQHQFDIPYFQHADLGSVSFGAGVLANTETENAVNPDGYIYIYGIRDPGKQLIVARMRPGTVENLSSWKFWNGNEWVADFTQSEMVLDSVSNEMSVSSLPDGRYIAVFQMSGILPDVAVSFSDTPYGPFGPKTKVWNCADALAEDAFFAYNAKGHPSLSEPGELLISYNVNSFKFWDQIEDHPNLYRPRFFKLIFD